MSPKWPVGWQASGEHATPSPKAAVAGDGEGARPKALLIAQAKSATNVIHGFGHKKTGYPKGSLFSV